MPEFLRDRVIEFLQGSGSCPVRGDIPPSGCLCSLCVRAGLVFRGVVVVEGAPVLASVKLLDYPWRSPLSRTSVGGCIRWWCKCMEYCYLACYSGGDYLDKYIWW